MKKQLRLYNSLSRRKETFTPLSAGQVTLYTCGPTVYDYSHLGNFRTFLFEDVLHRVLLWAGYRVKHVMNITDVGHLVSDADAGEDKMEKGARREGKSVWDIAAFYTGEFERDFFDSLNALRPDVLPKATDHIAEQIALVQRLEDKGFTYRISDGVYFDTARVADYGKLAAVDIDQLQEGARVEKNPEKRQPADFALWKFSPAGVGAAQRQMEWDSPWGKGFPGWHLECSAMSMKYLGETLDIHTGGIDHREIHHTNEIAQSEAATGKPFARVWMHGEFITVDGRRMGKSLGNFIRVADVVARGFDPSAYRYMTLLTHYRKPANFTWEGLAAADAALQRVWRFVASAAGRQAELKDTAVLEDAVRDFEAAIFDDLNMPQAVGVAQRVMEIGAGGGKDFLPAAATLLKFDAVLGLRLAEHVTGAAQVDVPAAVQKLVDAREVARATKNWTEADRLRDEISAAGYEVDDAASGPVVRKKS
ncbi:MAG: cysteine--tRNA ligase [Candidatus Kerfeldbacteria bacterium RIFCSPHIGHO2_12_FULL_48_17]|uniref:Cysteine--tRNA ligase n=1 Tax=Candidatus Kerfeldbacteria bacterium RIFCSPHIGHO2_12_FULL_48_17 TaxID=1798542 RepID=A0A1G2BAZ0_9BACT|nr:MAG: cysteine--tRNA ligase [Candidatus Kerfeldbacteria bacterium RIFCSPHIGHO2_12_FULL_48_17]